ncbi:prospero homeobox protein 1-like [Hippoglossus hippoglossus]|uniref:prospero homeobox protein 1-like n=1 Tax=Hippoglossus hippoglossus TaxID=8267 RepID=UPI00148C5AE7|nr:prospero homeobox protein 1-like [Hippoglossus hippoglossus]
MDSSVWSEGLYSTNICLDGGTAQHLSSFPPDPVPSNSDASGAFVTFAKDDDNKKLESGYYSRGEAGSSLIRSGSVELVAPCSLRRHLSPSAGSCGHHDRNLSSGRQAKRARVENIIKGMTSCPGMHCPDVTASQHEWADCEQEKERIRGLSSHQEHMETKGSGGGSHSLIRKQLESQQQHFRQLRTEFYQMDEVTETTENSEEKYQTGNNSPDTSPRDAFTDSCNEFESSSSREHQGCKKVKLMSYFQTKPERIKLMADVLKYELSRAVSRSVDSVFKSMPLLQTSTTQEGVETDVPLQSSVCEDKKTGLSCCGNTKVHVPDVQTEALSLVVQKPRLETPDKLVLQPRPRARPKPAVPFSHDSALTPSQKDHNSALSWLQDGCSEVGQAKFEMFDARWTSVKVRSKVNSRSAQIRTVDPTLLENRCFPQVKMESDSLVMLNEGLTTNHLKKAKLMFFYTRYPSSLVLKMCFHDVQFTRCITSQLIKWFSNFREFYYIQIEKFARHALVDGVADVRALTVGRESELFRALKVHYNKASDFQVPDRFLEVAEITLREFYISISMGKDRDPSWKKAIYKVICKLDSDVPTEFKSHHSG